MKILHFFSSFSFGGQQARLASIVGGMGARASHEVVAFDGVFDAREGFADGIDIQYRHLPMVKTGGVSLKNLQRIKTLIGDAAPDLVCTYNWGTIEAVIANRFGPKLPHIHFEDGFGPDETIEQQNRKRSLMRMAVLRGIPVIVPSRGLEALAKERWRLPNAQVRLIENGVDVDKFAAPGRVPQANILIGSVGSLRPEKNYSRLIEAVQSLQRTHRVRLEIVGSGAEQKALENAAAQLGEEIVRLPGASADTRGAYHRFDIFALSSNTEQAPISLMEAMSSGLPILSTDVGDIIDMVCDENRPFITPLGDEDAYRAALEALIKNPALRHHLGAENVKKAKAEFASDVMVGRYETLFDEVLKNSTR